MRRLLALKQLWLYLWPHDLPDARIRFIVALLALLLSKTFAILIPISFKYVIDFLANIKHSQIPWFPIVFYASARLLSSIFSELRDGIFAKVTQRTLRQAGIAVFKHLHNLSLNFHLKRKTGALITIINRGTKSIESVLTFLSFNIFPTIAEIFLVFILIWVLYNIQFAAIILLTMTLYIVYTLRLTQWRITYIKSMNYQDNQAQHKSIDSLLNYETIKYFCREEAEYKRLDQSLQTYEKAAIKSKISLSFLNIGQVIIISCGLALIMIKGTYEILNDRMTVGDLVALNTFLIQLYIPLYNLGFAYREVKLALINIQEMFDLLQESPEIIDYAQAIPLKVAEGVVIFHAVDFHYQNSRQVLRNISFQISPGHTVAIVGPSGAGKTTISRLLFRFYEPTTGYITIDNQNIQNVTQQSLRQALGIVPQDTVLFNESIYYNIAYAKEQATLEEVEQAARDAYIHDFIMKLPEQYQTVVGERGLKLSGGEKQRIAIARALLKNPSIMVFDEATSSLDTNTEKEIRQNIKQVSQNKTTLIIAHRLSTVIHANNILVLDKGAIVESGTHDELLARNGLYKKMWIHDQKSTH